MKLWIVRIEKSAYVMAETEAEAIERHSEIEQEEDYPVVSASLARDRKMYGWDDDCLVYHTGREDVRLGEARARCTDETPPERTE